MGRSVTPTFIVRYQNQQGWHRATWNSKTSGQPTSANLEKWRKDLNASMKPQGCNEHVSLALGFMLHAGNCAIVNQKTDCIVAAFVAPMFEEA